MTDSFVPFQPNTSVAAGRDDAILYGAVERDPGGLPRGTIEHITLSDFFNVAGETFQATVHLRSGRGTLRRGSVELEAPAGWTVEPRQYVGPVSSRRERTVTFDVTASGSAAVNSISRISALYGTGSKTGYTGEVVRIDRRSRVASSAGASGRSTTTGSPAPRRARCGSAARPPSSRSTSARRSPSRSTSTTGRPSRRAARRTSTATASTARAGLSTCPLGRASDLH